MTLKEKALKQALEIGLRFFSEDMLKDIADTLLDKIEEAIDDSKTQIDDIIAEPIIDAIREAFGIEDKDNAESDAE